MRGGRRRYAPLLQAAAAAIRYSPVDFLESYPMHFSAPAEGDVPLWDNVGTTHNAIPDDG